MLKYKRVLIVGSGAREHAIARALQRSVHAPDIFVLGSTQQAGLMATAHAYAQGDINDADWVTQCARDWQIDLAIIGPEAPLEKGVADALWQQDIAVIGPRKILAQIETSKAFARDLMQRHAISGLPRYQRFDNISGVQAFLATLGEHAYVIKVDGLAGGKGVKVAGDHLHSLTEAHHWCEQLVAAQKTFLIEEKCIGEEFSLLGFCDGTDIFFMPPVQDHKRAFVGDQGPNTGGMGSFSCADHSLPFLQSADLTAAQDISRHVLRALQQQCQASYIGILYGGFMATAQGVRVIEFNARFGDPEALNLLTILRTDFLEICQAMVAGKLAELPLRFLQQATVCKYVVPQGYPDAPVKNSEIDISAVQHPEQLYLAAIDVHENKLYATGSRAAAVVGVGDTLAVAEQQAESEVRRIKGNIFHREDIGTAQLIEKRVRHMRELRELSA